jgi:hypothetical protein
MLKKIACALALVSAAVIGSAAGASAEPRLALVIGEGAYRTGELPTAANDAGLVAQTLQSAGFEVVQGRDLGANELRQIVRDFTRPSPERRPGHVGGGLRLGPRRPA